MSRPFVMGHFDVEVPYRADACCWVEFGVHLARLAVSFGSRRSTLQGFELAQFVLDLKPCTFCRQQKQTIRQRSLMLDHNLGIEPRIPRTEYLLEGLGTSQLEMSCFAGASFFAGSFRDDCRSEHWSLLYHSRLHRLNRRHRNISAQPRIWGFLISLYFAWGQRERHIVDP